MAKLFLLCVLGIYICGVSGEGNSSQMYYFKLIVEENVVANVTQHLLNRSYSTVNIDLHNLTKTTECDLDSKTCRCADGFEWSDAACSSDQCCGAGNCKNTKFSCLSRSRVSLNGSLTLSTKYQGCLDETTSDNFKDCNNEVTHKIKETYSQIYGFHSLTIIKYNIGSVIVDFAVVIMFNVEPSVLQTISEALMKKLNTTLTLQTNGVVRLTLPSDKVAFGADVTLNCNSGKDLWSRPRWELKNFRKETIEIYNGTESTIISRALTSTILLKSASQLWTGTYTCIFKQQVDSLVINHKSSGDVDICVLPKISTFTRPGFPHCKSNSDLPLVVVYCEVEQTYEKYNVTWEKNNIDAKLIPQKSENKLGMTIFSIQAFVSCNSENPNVICKLTNRCGQETKETVEIRTIKAGSSYCKEDGDWEDTKAGETAVLKCKDSVGNRKRVCRSNETWEPETSFCVNLEVQTILTNAENSDIGQGELETNAGNVFTKLQNVTNVAKVLNNVANLKTSVRVIDTMSNKLNQLDKDAAVNNFLRSSSNMLVKSLENYWTAPGKYNNTESLAEAYLRSVEKLIKTATLSTPQKKEANVEVVTCTEKRCRNVVLNNSVTMDSPGADSIKTAGFLELQHYLPNGDDGFEPNSIIVSTTMQSKDKVEGIKISIDFQPLKPVPRNTKVKCVFWDMDKHEWSETGCKLKKGVCECNHLSAFAILMSKAPLQVAHLSEITYAGLAVSIFFLVICLGIELIIWKDVVKTDTLHLRHCAHVNISICLLVADVCFLASSQPDQLSDIWCKTFVVIKHFCYLAMFFWMLCLSSILLHKTVYLSLHGIGKTAYLRFSLIVGYTFPLLIVAITFLAHSGAEGQYYSKETCWLIYSGTFKGSIFSFILPVGIIVFVNIFFMCLVIIKLLQPIKAKQILPDKEKNSAKTVIRSVILLTPVFGLTWGLGFLMIILDLTEGPVAFAVNYAFTIMNAFQGLYIFLTTCLGDKMVRDGLRRYFKKTSGVSSLTTTTSSMDQSCIKEKPSPNSE